jgi:hypothetical protein
MARMLKHAVAAVVCGVLALVWTFPLVRHLSTHLPGRSTADNVDFLWNFWWMRTALASGLDFFSTPYLFVPVGSDLTLHTHTALPAFLGATLLGTLPIVTAQNLTILVALFLNGFCAYLLAWRLTRDHGAATIGGLVFGGSPYISAHLHGHFNLTTAWIIPLVAIAASEAIRGSTRWAAAAGLILGATAYVDYYYVVYELALVLCIVALHAANWSIGARGSSPASRRLARVVGFLILVDLAAVVAILMLGGFSDRIGPIRMSARGLFNPLQAFWILAALFLLVRFRPFITARREHPETGPVGVPLLIMTTVFLMTASPLLWKGGAMLLGGEYVTQQYFWRSAPKGIDAATLVLGNPFHGLWGNAVQRLYEARGIDAVESSAWMGVAPVLLTVLALRRHPPALSTAVRHWAAIGALFFLWALGPHLIVFGTNTGMILPQAVLRYVPLVNNARMPGRAIVVAYLALAVLASVAVAGWRSRPRGRVAVLAAVALAVIVDYLPAPFPVVALDRPTLYDTLRDRAEPGAVCELPLGIRHGFGERGAFDDRVLFYQTIHRRPIAGGFVARLPRSVAIAYEADPLFEGLLSLSEGEGNSPPLLPDRQLAGERLRAQGIAFVVLNRASAPPRLIDYVERVLPLTVIAEDGDRRLYLVSQEAVR